MCPVRRDRCELRVLNEQANQVVYVRDGLQADQGSHTTKWLGAKWNQEPHIGAFANPNNGDWKIKVAGYKDELRHDSREKTVHTTLVIGAEIADGAGPADSGLEYLANALKVEVSGLTTYTFGGNDYTLTPITGGKRLRLEDYVLDILEDGSWTIQLKDVRDDIGNFYDRDPSTPEIEDDEWTIELY